MLHDIPKWFLRDNVRVNTTRGSEKFGRIALDKMRAWWNAKPVRRGRRARSLEVKHDFNLPCHARD